LPRPSTLPKLDAMSRTVAIVEDEPELRANYGEALTRYGYAVQAFADRASARAAFALRLPDLVIIDVGLGDEPDGGFELCRELRARAPGLPILFLTARDSDLDVISGLRLGADDYLGKSISLPQLTARVTALLRRVDALRAPAARDSVFTLRGLRLELERMRVCWNDVDVPLTVTEFWMVHAMVRHPGHVKTREQLMREAQIEVDEVTVTSHIKRARRKFEAIDPAFAEIDTVHGAGYRWRP
jgi:two-component system, OmpR family, response regulator